MSMLNVSVESSGSNSFVGTSQMNYKSKEVANVLTTYEEIQERVLWHFRYRFYMTGVVLL